MNGHHLSPQSSILSPQSASSRNAKPVFYDEHLTRWPHIKRAGQIVGLLAALIFGVLAVGFVIRPDLPSLGLASGHVQPTHHPHAEPNPVPGKATSRIPPETAGWEMAAPPTASFKPGPRQQVIGFFVNWDDTSFSSLKQNYTRLDTLIPEWLHVADETGTIVSDDPVKERQVETFLKEHRSELPIVPLVNNFVSAKMEWEGEKIGRLLASPPARQRTIANLLKVVQTRHFAGISIDFENIPDASQKDLETFMDELYREFHPRGLQVSESVPLLDPNFHYTKLAQSNDYLILMAYDEHWSESAPGPVASQSWITRSLEQRFAQLPADKLVVAVGNYGYDWSRKDKTATEISFQEAMEIARDSEGNIRLDAASLNPTFDYWDETDTLHHVWYLDAVAVFNQMTVINRLHPQGVALWRLGSEDPSIWQVLQPRETNPQQVATQLQTIKYGFDLDYEGQGEVLKVTAQPHDGARLIGFDPATGLVRQETVKDFPSPFVIDRWGGKDRHKIALTFDDGPDPVYTPQILDVLRQNQVPATFFVIGSNASSNPALLDRMVAEGHEIGSHTFTHPNISVITEAQLNLELNSTQRLIESRTGRRTLLFRPPYAEDVEPENPEQVAPLLSVGAMGYYTIGMQIDPDDWKNPGVGTILNEVVKQTEAGQGNVVLLHDSGGDRSQTVAALPLIIKALRAKGYQFVPVSNLLGVSRDAVMPPVPANERAGLFFEKAGFSLIETATAGLKWLFLIGIGLGVIRLVSVSILAIRSRLVDHQVQPTAGCTPSVSVIVPAYNEEKVIVQTIRSLLLADETRFDIIVVDDGSSDTTYQTALAAFGNHPRVRVLTKPNGGKSQALNFGMAQTKADILVIMDADTVFHPQAINRLVAHFQNPQVGAVAGNAKVGNRINLLTRWQALEYVTSQNLDRRAYETLNSIAVVPGAIGAWRRELVLAAGGFTNDTLAEDADLTFAILKMGFRIQYEDQAIAYTEAPDSVGAFLKQRFRWMFGSLQTVWKHREVLFRPRFKALGMVVVPNVLIFQILFPLISPIMDLMMVLSLVNSLLQREQHPVDAAGQGLGQVLGFYLFFVGLDYTAAVIAFLLEKDEDWKLLGWLFFQRFFYRQLMYYAAVRTLFTALHGSAVGWNKLERKATVQLQEAAIQ
ncbi:MAG: glycosyltransferase [Blastocatellia bacterium]|nr:glycosyltransferase [Blastocatellia bacterium]